MISDDHLGTRDIHSADRLTLCILFILARDIKKGSVLTGIKKCPSMCNGPKYKTSHMERYKERASMSVWYTTTRVHIPCCALYPIFWVFLLYVPVHGTHVAE